MKKWLMLLSLGVLGGFIVLKTFGQKKDVIHFVESKQENKNFGAFPPEIPEEEFDALFV